MGEVIALTGATGYLGSHLLKAFCRAGHDVIVLKRSSSSISRIATELLFCRYYDVDVVPVSEVFDQNSVTMIVHAACSYGRAGETAADIFNANTYFPLRLLSAACNYQVPIFINVGTSLERDLNKYSISKSQFLDWGKHYSAVGDIKFVNVRLEHFFGPDDDLSKFISYLVDACSKTDVINLTAGEQTRDFIFIDDVVRAFVKVIENIQFIDSGFFQFDLGQGESILVREMVELIHALTKSQARLNFGAIPYRNREVMYSKADTSWLKSIGWSPLYSLARGLQATLDGWDEGAESIGTQKDD